MSKRWEETGLDRLQTILSKTRPHIYFDGGQTSPPVPALTKIGSRNLLLVLKGNGLAFRP
jgi:hypothetical protein